MIWIPLIFVPAVAWSRDLAVVTLVLGAFAIALRRDVNWRDEVFTNFRAPWTCVTAAFVFWSFLAVLWAPHLPLFAWLKVILALTATVILATGLARLPINNITQLATPIISSAGTLFGLLLFERLTDGLLIRVARPLDASVEILNTLSGGARVVVLCVFPRSMATLAPNSNMVLAGSICCGVLCIESDLSNGCCSRWDVGRRFVVSCCPAVARAGICSSDRHLRTSSFQLGATRHWRVRHAYRLMAHGGH